MEGEKLFATQKAAILEAEKEIQRLADENLKRDELRKRAGFGMLNSKPRCELCEVRAELTPFCCAMWHSMMRSTLWRQVCTGFEPNMFKPSVCKECSHLKVKHTRMPEEDG
jgi:hypothetical protein